MFYEIVFLLIFECFKKVNFSIMNVIWRNYFLQVARWKKQYLASTGEGKPKRNSKMLDLAGWLEEHVSFEDTSRGISTGLVHGDFKMDNLVFHAVEVCTV